jgi:Ca2+/Na+ antiporter
MKRNNKEQLKFERKVFFYFLSLLILIPSILAIIFFLTKHQYFIGFSIVGLIVFFFIVVIWSYQDSGEAIEAIDFEEDKK